MVQKPRTLVEKLRQNLTKVRVINQYDTLTKLAEQGNPELAQYLKGIGKKPTIGGGYKTLLREHIDEELNLNGEPTKIKTTIQDARFLKPLVKNFGLGILCLLGSSDVNR